MENFWDQYHNEFAKTYNGALDTEKNFIDSGVITNLVVKIIETYSLEEVNRLSLINIYTYRALGTLDEPKTLECLIKSKINWDTAQLILAEIKKDLEQLDQVTESHPGTDKKEALTISEEITEAEATLNSLRTMANDELKANTENVYPSQQEDLLTKKSPAGDNGSPKWGSD